MSAEAERVVVVLRERPPASILLQLGRLLGLGGTEVVRRIAAGAPLLEQDVSLAGRPVQTALLRDVLSTVKPYEHSVHVVGVGDMPTTQNLVSAPTLWTLIAPGSEPAAIRPVPDADLAAVVAAATRQALAQLPSDVARDWCAVALVTTGAGLRPYLSVTVDDDERWELAGSPYAVLGDEHFVAVADRWNERGNLWEFDVDTIDAEFALRLVTLEESLRLLDIEGLFGVDEARRRVLLLVATMPPDTTDSGFARRLNPPGPLLDRWLDEAAEGPSPLPTPGTDLVVPDEVPVPVLAALWRCCDGVLLDDGTRLYGPDEIVERNETFEVQEYAPGWVLIGDDSGVDGFLMRRSGPGFDPAVGRSAAEMFRLGLGALTEDIATAGVFVTDDVLGWLARR